MKDIYQVLRQKQLDMARVREEVEALHVVIPLLAEDRDRIESGRALPLSISQFRGTGTTGMNDGHE